MLKEFTGIQILDPSAALLSEARLGRELDHSKQKWFLGRSSLKRAVTTIITNPSTARCCSTAPFDAFIGRLGDSCRGHTRQCWGNRAVLGIEYRTPMYKVISPVSELFDAETYIHFMVFPSPCDDGCDEQELHTRVPS